MTENAAPRLLLVENDLISVWIYPEKKLVHHLMKAYCFGVDFREGLTRGVDAMERHGATKWLSDDRANGALPPEDLAWTKRVWRSRALAAGLKRWAIVQPAKLIGQVNLSRVVKQYADLGVEVRMFGDPDEAMKWLDEP